MSIHFCVFQEVVSVADIVLWAALYPVFSDSSLALGRYTKYVRVCYTCFMFQPMNDCSSRANCEYT